MYASVLCIYMYIICMYMESATIDSANCVHMWEYDVHRTDHFATFCHFVTISLIPTAFTCNTMYMYIHGVRFCELCTYMEIWCTQSVALVCMLQCTSYAVSCKCTHRVPLPYTYTEIVISFTTSLPSYIMYMYIHVHVLAWIHMYTHVYTVPHCRASTWRSSSLVEVSLTGAGSPTSCWRRYELHVIYRRTCVNMYLHLHVHVCMYSWYVTVFA